MPTIKEKDIRMVIAEQGASDQFKLATIKRLLDSHTEKRRKKVMQVFVICTLSSMATQEAIAKELLKRR